MANKALEQARKAYNKNQQTKGGQKQAKKNKAKKKKEKAVGSSWDSIREKTQSAGKAGENNRKFSISQSKSAVSKASGIANDNKERSRSKSGAVTPVKPTTGAGNSHRGATSTNVTRKADERRKGVAESKRAREVAGDVIRYAGKDLVATGSTFLANGGKNKAEETDYKAFGESLKNAAEGKKTGTYKPVKTAPKDSQVNQRTGTWETKKGWKKMAKFAGKATESALKELEDATKNISDEKKYEMPELGVINKIAGVESTKKQKKKAKAEIDKTLKDAGLTVQDAVKGAVELNQWGKEQGWDDDTMLANGKTWGETRKEAAKDMIKNVYGARIASYKGINDVGKLSKKDLTQMGIQGGVAMAEMLAPYIGTAGKALKGIDALSTGGKALTAVEGGTRVLTKAGETAVKNAVKASGGNTLKGITDAAKTVAKSDLKTNIKREILANALQDSTIGTTIDYMSAQKEGLTGKDAWAYLGKGALLNAALGAPIAGIAGRTGKAGKAAINQGITDSANAAITLSKAEGIELGTLLKKADNGILMGKEQERLLELQQKAFGSEHFTVNTKGKIVRNDADTTIEALSREDAKKYLNLQAKQASGTLRPDEIGQFVQLQRKVQKAYKQTETVSEKIINLKTLKSGDLQDAETAVRFYERTGDEAKLKVAQKALEAAQVATKNLNESLDKAMKIMTDKTGIEYKWVTGDEMRAMGASEDSIVKGFTDFDKKGNATVYINRESPQAWQAVVGHETMHLIKKSNPQAYKELADSLEKYVKEIGDYDELEATMRRNYPELQGNDPKNMADFREEMVSEMLGRYVFGEDDKFIKRLAGENPTALEKMVDYIKSLVKKVKNPELADQFNNFLKSAEDAIGAINKDEVAKNAKEETPKFSIVKKVTAKDGKEYENVVKLDSDIFRGIKNDGERARKFRQFVYDEMAGKAFKAYDQNGTEVTIEIARYGERHKKDGSKNRNRTINELAVRPSRSAWSEENRIAVEQANELIEVAKHDRLSPNNAHGKLDRNGWEYRTLNVMSQKGNIFDAVLDIAKTEDGRNLLYSVKIKRKIGEVAKTADSGLASSNLPKKSVSQAKNNVNTPDTNVAEAFKNAKPLKGKASKEVAHRDELLSDAEESYGAKYTDDFNETGFIFPDGKLPKMGDYGQRADDHAIVVGLYDDIGYDTHNAPKSAAMGRFLDEGNIRIMPENGSIEMSAKVQPTSEQYSAIRRFLNEHDEAEIEFSGVDGRSVDSKAYSNGVNAEQVINDIKRFYSDGKIGGSDLNNFRYSKENIGYHAGDLGKAESMGNQTGGRGTGHFGTGTYFVGNKAKISDGSYGKRPVETVNFDKYNLYKPYNTKEAYELHDFLRDVNGYFDLVDSPKSERNFVANIKRRTDDIDYKLWDAEDDLKNLESSVKSMDDDGLLAVDIAEQKVKKLREEVYNIGKDALGESEVEKLIKGEDPSDLSHESANEILWKLQHPDKDGWYSNWERNLDNISSFYNSLDLWAMRLRTSKDKLLESLRKAKEQSEKLGGSEERYTADSASTILMKDLGYEGVDVRHTDLDNTQYGSVIYDLKGEDLARKKEIGTAKYSKEVNAKNIVDNTGKVTKEANDAYMAAAKAGDEETARKYVRALAEAKGGLPAYHGTNARFTVFDPAKLGSKNWNAPSAQMGFFAGKSRQTAEAYTGLDSATAAGRMSFSEEGRADAKAIREKYDADKVDDKFFKDREKFFDDYKAQNGYKEEVDDRLKEVEDNGLFRNATDPDTLRENIHRTLEIMWNEEHLNDMYAAFEKTDTAVKKREFDAKIYDEWEQKQIERLGYDPHVMELYAFMEKPFIHDFKGEGRDVESFAARMAKAKEQGCDGCMFLNVADGGELDDIYTVFSNKQFKSADAITRDDNNEIIPLSERFNFKNEDIRFSKEAKPEKPLTVKSVISDFTKDSRFVGDKKAFGDEVRELAELMRKDGLTTDVEAKVDDIIAKHIKINEYEEWGEGIDPNVKSLIKSSAINISELGDGTIAHKLENIGLSKADVPSWVQLRSAKGGRSLDSVYHELSDERPDLFPPDASHEDKLLKIIEASKQEPEVSLKPQEWIDGEKNDLKYELITKVADADYAEMKALEAKAKPKAETLNPEVEKQIKQLEKERNSLISRWEDTRYTKPDGKIQRIIDSYNAEIERLKNGGSVKDTTKETVKVAKPKAEPKPEKPKTTKKPAKKKEPEKTEVQKLHENDYVSDNVKTALKDIDEAGDKINVAKAEKIAKRFNDLDKKIGAKTKHIENAKKSEKYATEAERSERLAELNDELETLKRRQAKAAGELEQLGKMKAVDPNKTAEQQIKEMRGERKVNKELKNTDNLTKTDNWIKDKWNSVRRLWEDSLIDVENTAKASGDMELRNEILTSANRVRNSMSVANNWITKTRSKFDNTVGGKALDDIFSKELIDNEPKYADFQEYLIMKHVPARHAKGTDIYPEVSPELAAKRVKELEDKYRPKDKDGNPLLDENGKPVKSEVETWADDVYDYINDLQQYRVDSGMLSQEAADQFAKDYPFYVPTNRVSDENIDFFTGGTSNGIRSAKGGDSDVLDIYSQLYTATNKTIHAAEENQMLNLYFKAKGVTEEQLKDATLDDLEHAVIEAKVNKKTGASTVSFFVDGKPVRLPCNHQLALGLRELDGLEFERLLKAAKVATLYGKPFKALVTDWNLVFGVRNGARDLQQALVNSKDTKFFASSTGAAAHAIAHQDSPFRKLYASMGGEQAQLVSYDAVAKQMGIEKQGRVDAIHEKVQEIVDFEVKGKHINPIHYVEAINGSIEMMPRMCEFIGTIRKEADQMLKRQGSSLKQLRKDIIAEVDELEKAGKIGQTAKSAEVEDRLANKIIDMVGKDTIDTAMRNANDITLNFGRSGVIGKALNMGFVPYLNPSIQGLSKLVRLFTEAGQEGGWKALASIGMKLGTFTIAPAVLNEVLLKDNEDYQNLNTRDKDNNFFIPLDKFGEEWEGKFFKFPKPRENAVLAEAAEYGLRYFLNDSEYAFFDWDKLKMEDVPLWEKIPLTDEGKQSFRTAIDNIGVINPATSNMLSPMWQTFHNKTWYGGSIESAYETSINEETGKPNVPVNERYDVATSGIAIALGQTKVAKELNLSPKKIDNILDSYTGMIYDLGISQTTEEAKTRGNWLFRTMASQFVKDSVFSNKLSTNAWGKMDGMNKKEQDAYKSTYMYDTFKYDDAQDLITADKNLTNKEKMDAKRALQIAKNKLNREAIDGKPNTSNPLVDIAKHLGATKTLNHFLPDTGGKDTDTWTDYFKTYKNAKGYSDLTKAQKDKQSQKFLDVYSLGVKGQLIQDPTKFHDSPSWGMTGVAAAELAKKGKLKGKDADLIMKSCGVYDSQTEVYHNYAEFGGNVKRYAITEKRVGKTLDKVGDWGMDTKSGLWKGKFDKSMGAKGGTIAMSLATSKKVDFKDRAYYIANSSDPQMLDKMNAARGFSEKYGHKTKEISKLALQADALGDGNTYLKNDEIINVCNQMKGNNEEKSMAYVLLGGKPGKNPFGAIGDYSHDGDTGIKMLDDGKSGGGGRRRRGRRGHGGGGGGSSKGTMPKTESGAIKGKVTDAFASSNTSKASNLNDAYRKKVRKLRKELHK